jgi:hypothetical protein
MTKKKIQRTVPVSLRALVQRVNRKLRPDNEALRATRPGTRAAVELGDFYILRYGGAAGSNIIAHHVDPESYGRELGALAAHEHVVAD